MAAVLHYVVDRRNGIATPACGPEAHANPLHYEEWTRDLTKVSCPECLAAVKAATTGTL